MTLNDIAESVSYFMTLLLVLLLCYILAFSIIVSLVATVSGVHQRFD